MYSISGIKLVNKTIDFLRQEIYCYFYNVDAKFVNLININLTIVAKVFELLYNC